MVTITAFAMVTIFMALIMTRRMSALVALLLVPTAFALFAGHSHDLGTMMLQGVKEIAPTGIMLIFAILYFGLMIDVGLFDPLVRRIVKLVGSDPVRINIGTIALALVVGLDGDGSTTYMITIAAMLPIYRRLGLDPRILACLAIMASAISNILPWGGPVARAASALRLDPGALFFSLLPSMLATSAWLFLVAIYLGRRERLRIAEGASLNVGTSVKDSLIPENGPAHFRRPQLIWLNFALTAALLVLLMLNMLPLPVLFMVWFGIALTINYPLLADQRERIHAHAGNALSVGGLVFAAGIFTGILSGTGMVDAMADSLVAAIPPAAGPYLSPITAMISIPFTFFISNDAFYFGMLPVLAEAGAHYGLSPQEIARASLVGQQFHLLSPLVPSTYLLVGLVGIEMGDHQRYSIKWALGSCAVFLVSALIFGAFPIVRL